MLLKIFDLQRGTEIHSVDKVALRLPANITRGWICDIVGYSDSGLFVKAGLSKNSISMEYFVAKLDVMQKTLAPIVILPAAFM